MLIQSRVSLPPSPYKFFSILPTKYCNQDIFIRLNLPILLVPVRQGQRSQKCIDLSAFNYNLNHSIL